MMPMVTEAMKLEANHKKGGAPAGVTSRAQAAAWLENSNVAHVDGHVESYSVKPLVMGTWAALSWNSDQGSWSGCSVNPATGVIYEVDSAGNNSSKKVVVGPDHIAL